MTAYLGIYKAIYAYEPQTDEELAIGEDDFLYLLEKSEVDDWWTVKKRAIGADIDEPVGLVPSNYIEEALPIYRAQALYDYEEVQNPDDELSFREGDMFDIFDDRDADWLLCRAVKDGSYGFIPGNYVEKKSETEVTPHNAVSSTETNTQLDSTQNASPPANTAPVASFTREAALQFPPPSQPNKGRPTAEVSTVKAVRSVSHDDRPLPALPSRPESSDHDSEEEAPPPKPQRPNEQPTHYFGSKKHSEPSSRPSDPTPSLVWNVKEINGRRKKDAKLALAVDGIKFIPSDDEAQRWAFENLVSFDNEKKHVFLEFKNPYTNLELHAGSNDAARSIISNISDWRASSEGPELREVAVASNVKKRGVIKYDFKAESSDELTVREGQEIYILNDVKSPDWWVCELPPTGKKGLIPSQFIELRGPRNASSGIISPSAVVRTKSTSSKASSQAAEVGSWKHDVDQDNSMKRKSSVKKKNEKGKRKYPDPRKTRIWVDRSNTFKVEAEFLGFVDGKIHLHKVNGVKIAVAADKLCNEDLNYVENVAGLSLEKYRSDLPSTSVSDQQLATARSRDLEEKELERKLRERELAELRRAKELLEEERERLRASQNDTAARPKPSHQGSDKSKYDWFEFFLNCGVDVKNCQRYSAIFEREQMDEEILPDLRLHTLRSLEIKEGDVIRIMKALDKTFGRENSNAYSSDANSVNNNNLPERLQPDGTSRDDDAWTIKPAATSESTLSNTKKAFSGSLQDLLDLKPLEPKKKEEVPKPNMRELEQVRTGGSNKKPTAQQESQPSAPAAVAAPVAQLDPFKTGGHNLLPMITGGMVLMPVMTGGLIPLSRTGNAMMPQTTFGAQVTGGMLNLNRTGGVMMPQTTFGTQTTGNILPVQKTAGGLVPVAVGTNIGVPQTTFGTTPMMNNFSAMPLPLQRTGGAVVPMSQGPQASLGNVPMGQAMTGGLIPVQRTGGLIPMQQTGHLIPLQRTGGVVLPMGQAYTGGAPTLPLQGTGGVLPYNANFPQTTFGTTSITQPAIGTYTGMQQTTGGVGTMPQTFFGTNSLNQANTGIQNMNLAPPPLQNQPTGFGFGNAPPQQQVQPKQANIYNASAANPFGF